MFQSQTAHQSVAKFLELTTDGISSAVSPVGTEFHLSTTEAGVCPYLQMIRPSR